MTLTTTETNDNVVTMVPVSGSGAASLATEHFISALDSKHPEPLIAATTHTIPADPATTSKDPETELTLNDIAPNKRSKVRVMLIMLALYLSLFVSAMDATIIATAIPVITHELNSAAGYTWIGGAYLLAHAAASPIWAKLSDIWGRKTIMLALLTLFFASSIVCATAGSMKTLIVGRALQGSAGGGLILLVHIVVSDLFSLRLRSLLISTLELVWTLAGATGPLLGGVFASLVTWRWCFYINLPVCGLAFLLILLFLDVKHERTSLRTGLAAIDWFGIAAFLACTIMLLLGLDFGGAVFAWSSAKVIVLIVLGACMIGVFIYSEARLARYPLIPLDLFKQKSNVASLGVAFFHGLGFMPGEYYTPLYWQAVKQATPLRSGILLVPLIVVSAVVAIVTGVVIHQTGRYRELMWIGTAILTVGLGLLISVDADTSTGQVIGFTVIFGIGSGLLFEPPLIAIQAHAQQQDVATATATMSFCRSLAIAISVILGGIVFQNSMDIQAAELKNAGLPSNVVQALNGREAAANVGLAAMLDDPVQKKLVEKAFAWSMRNMWIMYTALAALGLFSSLFVGSRALSRDHVETVTGIKSEEKRTEQEGLEMI